MTLVQQQSTQTRFHLNGKEINLTSEDVSINSDNLQIDKNGNINVYSDVSGMTDQSASFTIQTRDLNNIAKLFPNLLRFNKSNGYCIFGTPGWPAVFLKNNNNANQIAMQISDTLGASILLGDAIDNATISISLDGIKAPVLTQTSKESKKKNITEYNGKALDIVKESEIYTYNFKSEKDEDKKHYGFVIGDEGGEYKTPEQVISNDREGIDTYSMTSILWKAFQEYIQEKDEQIKQLQNEINELKKESE